MNEKKLPAAGLSSSQPGALSLPANEKEELFTAPLFHSMSGDDK
jgi:hypothetical protein